jgi:MFS family permease
VFIKKVQGIYQEFPGTFWTLMGATFIDGLGGALLFPFFALYVTQKFGVGMTEVGILFGIFAVMNFIGSLIGGAVTDKLGRRWMILFGLVMSGLSSLLMAWVDNLALFYVLAAFVGLLAEAGRPAQQAMVADLLPREKQAEGYGTQRVVMNLTVVIGPVLGGLLASQSYTLLFVADAVTSVVTAIIVYMALPESKPQPDESTSEQSMWQTLRGYGDVVRDGLYMAFLGVSVLAVIVYIQMNSTLSVYLRDVHGVSPQGFGYILSMNAAMVVLFQFWVTRRVSKRAPMLMLALGTAVYGIGFAMYGFVSSFALFFLAMAIITIGEMIVVPVGQALVAKFAPEDMRGRYMAMFGFSWTIPFAVGPFLAGLIMDNTNPNWVWYASGILAAVAVIGYLYLHTRVEEKVEESPELETLAAAPAGE